METLFALAVAALLLLLLYTITRSDLAGLGADLHGNPSGVCPNDASGTGSALTSYERRLLLLNIEPPYSPGVYLPRHPETAGSTTAGARSRAVHDEALRLVTNGGEGTKRRIGRRST
jgi:hypothetical protein